MKLWQQVQLWLRRSGKVWLFRSLVIATLVNTGIARLPYFRRWALTTDVLLLMVVALLFILFEICLDALGEVHRDRMEGVLYAWNDAVPLMRREVQAARSLFIVARSGEMAYHAFRDLLAERTDKMSTEVFMVRVPSDDVDFEDYQSRWRRTWMQLSPCVKSVHVIRAGASVGLGCVIIDGCIGYLGYSKLPTPAPAGRPSLRVTSKTQEGLFLLNHYREWAVQHIAKEPAPPATESVRERNISSAVDGE